MEMMAIRERRFPSPCAEACPTGALTLSFGGAPTQTLRVPRVNENLETNVSGVYIVGELSGMGMIKTAINEGKLVIDYLKRRLAQEQQAEREDGELRNALSLNPEPEVSRAPGQLSPGRDDPRGGGANDEAASFRGSQHPESPVVPDESSGDAAQQRGPPWSHGRSGPTLDRPAAWDVNDA